jgi:hypothetical protein
MDEVVDYYQLIDVMIVDDEVIEGEDKRTF